MTTINNPEFIESFLKLLQYRANSRLFNLNSERWVDSIEDEEEDEFFNELLEELRIAYLS